MDPALWQQHALANRLQSLLLLALMAGFTTLVGWLLWGQWRQLNSTLSHYVLRARSYVVIINTLFYKCILR